MAVAGGIFLAAPTSSVAQTAPQPYDNVISANPFGILLEWFNLEYERVISESATIGAGGSIFTNDEESYRNFDAFGRFYLRDQVLVGPMFGARLGVTDVPDQGVHFGIGFDLNWSWLMGPKDNFYIGAGFGLKRLLGVDDDDSEDDSPLSYIPTFRIVNVGIAF